MTVLDTEFIIHHLLEGNVRSTIFKMGLQDEDVQILPATIADVAETLILQGEDRKDIARYILEIVTNVSVEDPTMHLYACLVFAKSDFSYPDCLVLAYAYLDHIEPTFSNPELEAAYRRGQYRYTD